MIRAAASLVALCNWSLIPKETFRNTLRIATRVTTLWLKQLTCFFSVQTVPHISQSHCTPSQTSCTTIQSLPNQSYGRVLRNQERNIQRELASTEASVIESLPNSLKKAKELASQKGASSWLTALLITDHGFCLHKGAFHDTLCLRYNWSPPLLPSSCVCGSSFQVDHALSCYYGNFPSIRHNELRDLKARLLTEVCSKVGVEPVLQPLGDERMDHRMANSEDSARLDIKKT